MEVIHERFFLLKSKLHKEQSIFYMEILRLQYVDKSLNRWIFLGPLLHYSCLKLLLITYL